MIAAGGALTVGFLITCGSPMVTLLVFAFVVAPSTFRRR
jgi:hypothetical protein